MSQICIEEIILFLIMFPLFIIVTEKISKWAICPASPKNNQKDLYKCHCQKQKKAAICNGKADCTSVRILYYINYYLMETPKIWYISLAVGIYFFISQKVSDEKHQYLYTLFVFIIFFLIFAFTLILRKMRILYKDIVLKGKINIQHILNNASNGNIVPNEIPYGGKKILTKFPSTVINIMNFITYFLICCSFFNVMFVKLGFEGYFAPLSSVFIIIVFKILYNTIIVKYI